MTTVTASPIPPALTPKVAANNPKSSASRKKKIFYLHQHTCGHAQNNATRNAKSAVAPPEYSNTSTGEHGVFCTPVASVEPWLVVGMLGARYSRFQFGQELLRSHFVELHCRDRVRSRLRSVDGGTLCVAG